MMGQETGDRHRSSCKRDCRGMTGPRVLVRIGMMTQVDFECYRLVKSLGQAALCTTRL